MSAGKPAEAGTPATQQNFELPDPSELPPMPAGITEEMLAAQDSVEATDSTRGLDPNEPPAPPFALDTAGAGFDAGAFGPGFQRGSLERGSLASETELLATENGQPIATEDGSAIEISKAEVPSGSRGAGAGYFKLRRGDADLSVRHAPRTVIGKAVLSNQLALQLAALSLLAALDAKLEQIREQRSNSEDFAQYEELKRRVEEFLAASSSAEEAPVVKSTLSLAAGLRNWWTADHASICNRALNISLLAGGLGICGLAGAFGTVSVVTVGTLIAGKDIPAALEACVKLLKSAD
jgi:hypothetical protein